MLDRLSEDIRNLVMHHLAASVLQCHLTRWHRLRHVVRRAWPLIRARMPRGVHALLVRHAAIRREWYTEPESWLYIREEDLRQLVVEAGNGAWGRALVL